MAQKARKRKTTIKKTIIEEIPTKRANKSKIVKTKKTTKKIVRKAKPKKQVDKQVVINATPFNLGSQKMFKVAYIQLEDEPEDTIQQEEKIVEPVVEEEIEEEPEKDEGDILLEKLVGAIGKKLGYKKIEKEEKVDVKRVENEVKINESQKPTPATIKIVPLADENKPINNVQNNQPSQHSKLWTKIKATSIVAWIFFGLFFAALIGIGVSWGVLQDEGIKKILINTFASVAAGAFIISVLFFIIKSFFINEMRDIDNKE